jgi:hypothetical protein
LYSTNTNTPADADKGDNLYVSVAVHQHQRWCSDHKITKTGQHLEAVKTLLCYLISVGRDYVPRPYPFGLLIVGGLPYSCHNVAQFQLSPQVIDQFCKKSGQICGNTGADCNHFKALELKRTDVGLRGSISTSAVHELLGPVVKRGAPHGTPC